MRKSAAALVLALVVAVSLLWSQTDKASSPEDASTAQNVWFPAARPSENERLRIEPEKSIVRAWRGVHSSAQPGEPKGTVFHWRSDDDSVQCGAGFVYSVGSRIFSNQNQLEFWCRPIGDDSPLEFVQVRRPLEDFPQSYIGNVNGRLFEYVSRKTYNFTNRRWQDLGSVDRRVLGGASPYVFQHYGETSFVIATGYSKCPGLSFFSQQGYHGTVDTGPDFSAVALWRGAAYINANYELWRVSLLPTPRPVNGTCHILSHHLLDAGPDWVYAFYPHSEYLYYGGSISGTEWSQSKLCAELHRVNVQGDVDRLPTDFSGRPCEGRKITEYYSYTAAREGALVGNFPHGTLLSLGHGKIEATDMARPLPGSFIGSDGTRYRESQSVVSAYGRVFVGMYPWAEVYEIDPESGREHVQRLMTAPRKTSAKAPYYAKNEAMPELEPTHWGQRITTLAVLNGHLCAGTGNLRGERYSAEKFPQLHAHDTLAYGSVHCALLPNHTLANGRVNKKTELHFIITKNALYIAENENIIARAPATFAARQQEALCDSQGQLTIGLGNYGDFAGAVELVADNRC